MKLSIRHVSKSYGKTRALTDFCADLGPGIYALLGPNGSGKSTLMNIITDNLAADEGEITFSDGEGEPENVLTMGARFRERVGFMPQYTGMYPHFTVGRFMWYAATLKDVGADRKGRDRNEYVRGQIASILAAVGLDDAAHRRIGTLSGGMKQRLALAQAVLGGPSVLILDEPTAGLDPKQRIAIRNLIAGIALDRIVIIATHVVPDVEYIAREVIMLKKGRVVDQAPPHELTRRIEGRVWQVPAAPEEAAGLQEQFRGQVVNIQSGDGGVLLRILSDTKPTDTAVPVPPTLEDYYLSVFGTV